MQLLRTLLTLSLTNLLCLALAHADVEKTDCSNLLSGRQGTFVSRNTNGALYFLGEGGTAKAYRLIKPNGQTQIQKIYNDLETLESDLRALMFYDEIIKELKIADKVSIPQVLSVQKNTNTVIFEDYFGQPLDAIIKDGLSARENIAAWQDNYIYVRDRINAYIQHKFANDLEVNIYLPGETPVFDINTFLVPFGDEYHAIAIKPDNVLITPSGKLILFDPA